MNRAGRGRAFCFLALLACAALLGGCWDYTDIDRRGIVLGMGIEPGDQEGTLAVSVDIANPQALSGPGPLSGSSSGGNSLLLTQQAPSVLEALQLLQARVDRRLDLPFVQIILVQEQIARNGLDDVIDFTLRNATLRSNACLMLTPDSPSELLAFTPTLGPGPSLWYLLVSQNSRATATFPRCTTLTRLHSDSTEIGVSLVPRVAWGSQGRPLVRGAGVLSGFNLVGWLDATETEGALWWNGQMPASTATVPCEGGGRVVLALRQARRRITFAPDDAAQFQATLRLGVRAAVREVSRQCSTPSGRPLARSEQVIAAVQRVVFERAWMALEAARRLRTDFLDLGLTLRRHHPQRFRELSGGRVHAPEVLDMPVFIEVDVTITEYGELD